MDNLESLRELTRSQIRTICVLTGWSTSRLASEAGLAASTLNRFMNKDVKYNLSQTTMAMVVIKAITRIMERVADEPHTLPPSYWRDVQSILPLAETLFSDPTVYTKEIGEENEDMKSTLISHMEKMREFVEFMKNKVPKRVAGRDYKSEDPEDLKKRYPAYSEELLSEIVNEAIEGRSIAPQEEGRRMGNLIATKIIGNIASPKADTPEVLPHLYLGVKNTNIKDHQYGSGVTYAVRPWLLKDDKEAFSLMMLGDSMEPKFTHTARLYATPNKTVQRRDFVVIESKKEGLSVGRMIYAGDEFIEVGFLSPAETIKYPIDDVLSISKIVASTEPD